MIKSMFWCHEKDTIYGLYISGLNVKVFISYDSEITCHNMATWGMKKLESEQEQGNDKPLQAFKIYHICCGPR